mmetsp:Transcript_17771/g.32099  ORF Transcript_17771/g.32099 Transcript_17771/m.32099 type:complete len:130 (+) Transcript_17771:1450-1839(+)
MCSTSRHPKCANDRATLKLSNRDFTLSVTKAFTLRSVILDGAIVLKAGCSEPTCLYCPYLLISDVATNDRGEVVDLTNYAQQSDCNYFLLRNFFAVTSTGTLRLESVRVQNFRQQLREVALQPSPTLIS